MPDIDIRRKHCLGLGPARDAVQRVAESLQADLQAKHRWQGDRLEFECPGAKGVIGVDAQEVAVSVSLSWLLRPMRGRIERSVEEYLDRELG